MWEETSAASASICCKNFFFAIPDYVLCKAVKASSEQETDYFQILLLQEYYDNKIRPGVLKRFGILFQGD